MGTNRYLNHLLTCALLLCAPLLAQAQDESAIRTPPIRITLISPQPEDTLCAATPQFSWSATALPANAHFQFEMYDVQTSNTARLNQLPIWQAQSKQSVYRPQPGTLPIEQGKPYAWRVTTIQNGQTTGISDAHSFHYGCPTPEKNIPVTTSTTPYCRMGSPQAPPTYQMTDQTLAFYFTQRYPNDTLRLHVYNDSGNLLSQKTLQTNPGNNYMRFSTSELGLDAESKEPLSLILTANFQEPLALRLEQR